MPKLISKKNTNNGSYFYTLYDWRETDIIDGIISDKNGKRLKNSLVLKFIPSDSSLYTLDDESIVLRNSSESKLFSSFAHFKLFLSEYVEFGGFKETQTCFPFNKIHNISNQVKIVSIVVHPEIGKMLLSKAVPLNELSSNTRFVHSLRTNELIEYNKISNTYSIFRSNEEYTLLNDFYVQHNHFLQCQEEEDFFRPNLIGLVDIDIFHSTNRVSVINLFNRIIYIPEKKLTYNTQSLKELNKYLYSNIISWELRQHLFLPLLYYIGETIISEKGGEWETRYDKFGKFLIPDIKLNGRFMFLFDVISKILSPEEEEYIHLVSIINRI